MISSDSPPKEIPGLVERLRSRFEWGLMADIQPPDLETKMAILDKKAEAEGVKLPDDVRIFMASKTKSNVRELEGALVKLMAYSSLTGTPINLADGAAGLEAPGARAGPQRSPSMPSRKPWRTSSQIKQSQFKEKSNTKKIVYPRQVAMYLVKELTSGLVAGDRPGVRRQAPHHRHPLHKQDRQLASQ